MTRGGKREGSGRPETGRTEKYSTKLRLDHKEWLKKQKNAAVEIEKALDKHIEWPDQFEGDPH